ncbi:uncharacterized protein RHOBADRAFT_55888 [Rhodotorula graminis WP1]|uniref:RNA polymerase II-associated protein 1 C-terminal domain-containing protein n=1 Tax=Rhodotorula graminis (strain WP1) TaxID=578459 RepID=A0A0P9EGF2_RHOGW|nr:uncharacterized protein RHOBADRAFT_55888 [Rhodotorula graminis WP1]KPV72422.1 hypothetical protein RHOBADRAFT_55888 [Rhodotorula graminis WP1]
MAAQRIRPSLADLYDEPAFPELEPGQAPAARVVRQRPPAVSSSSLPPPIPVVPPSSADQAASPPPPSKPKSRFALQREKDAAATTAAAAQAAAAAATQPANSAQRFELDLDDEGDEEPERGGGALPRGGGRPSLIKGVVERPVGARGASAPKPPSAPGPSRPSPLGARPTGFPSSSRGVFPRQPAPPPPATSFASPDLVDDRDPEAAGQDADPTSLDGLLDSVSRENDDVLRGMSEAQILEEQRQIREELGLSDGVLKMLQARAQKRSPAPRIVPTPRARPAPADAPAPRPTVAGEGEGDEEEGSPEYIRRHFFPNEPRNPALDWMKPPPPPAGRAGDAPALPAAARLVFDVQGRLLEGEAAPVAPAAAPDHHVSSSTTFTVPSLLALTASSVPSQRSTAFAILHRILSRSVEYAPRFGEQEWQAVRVQAAQRAGWALRDSNLGVVGACIALAAVLLAQDVAAPVAAAAAPRLEGAEETATVASTFLETAPLPALASHLSLGAVPRPSLDAVLAILTSLVHLSRSSPSSSDILDSIFDTPRLLESLVSTFLAVPYPPSSKSILPSPTALAFLALLARTSRSRASLLCTRSLVDPTLRFIALPPWELPPSNPAGHALGDALLRGTIELWTVLARYGLATDLRGKAAPLLDGLVERVGELRRASSTSAGAADAAWIAPFLGLLGMWTTAAVDPHVTGHDVTWSQVEGFRDVALEAYELGFAIGEATGAGRAVLSAAVELLGSWLEGSKVNRSWRGEEERRWVRVSLGGDFAAGGRARTLVDRALAVVASGEEDLEGWAGLAARALRLSDADADVLEPATPQLFALDAATASAAVSGVVGSSARSSSLALAAVLLPRLDLASRLSATVALLPMLGVEDAVAARDLVEWLLALVAKPDNHILPPVAALDARLELPALAQAATLRPFLTYAIVTASGGRVVGPLFPTPRDIKLTACLAPFAPDGPVLSPNWPLAALNELLRSGTSPVFQQLPKGWDASELQLVRSSLALMRFVRSAAAMGTSRAARDAPALVYDLVKVFMLEKDSSGTTKGSSGADAEVFRDPACQASLGALLAELSVGAQASPQVLLADERDASATIEGVSAVVSSAPFYQLYTDLVGLYDAISLSDRLFGLVLLPPLAMAYPIDYRRLIWTDYAHVLPALKFSVDEAISDVGGAGALSAYLAPAESSEPMLAAYVDALVGGRVSSERTPFLHFVALHHVAAALLEHDSPAQKSAVKLVKALVGRGASKTLGEVARYRQAQVGEELILSPACLEAGAEQRAMQVARLKELAGSELAARVDELLR